MSSLLDDDFVYQYEPEDFQFDTDSELSDMRKSVEVSPSLRRQVLKEAADIIDGDRNKTYGKPENSYDLIAKFWSIYLDKQLDPYDIAALMILMKMARIKGSNGTHKDSWVDIAGYAACGYEVKQSTN